MNNASHKLMRFARRLSRSDKFWILVLGLIIGALLGASFHKETVVVREGTADTPAAQSSVNLMIDYGNGSIKTWNTVSWNEAMSILDLTQKVASAKEIAITTKPDAKGVSTLESIDSIANDGSTNMRWQFWVDNTYEPRTAGKYYLKPGDIVLWKYVREQKNP